METFTCAYALEMDTPLGKRRGSLTLHLLEKALSGELTLFTRTTPIREGRRSGSDFTFRGEIKMLVGALPCEVCGTLRENGLEMEIRTARGRYPCRGVLTEKRRD